MNKAEKAKYKFIPLNDLPDELIDAYDFERKMIHHPLYVDFVQSGILQMHLDLYEARKADVEKARAEKKWFAYIFTHERGYRIWAYKKIRKHIALDERGPLLRDIWGDSENICQHYAFWKKMLSSGEWTLNGKEAKFIAKLPPKLTVYRGCPKKSDKGLSWTLDRKKAQWFANRFGRNGIVVERVIKKSEIRAYLNERKEREIVLLPEVRKRRK